jgi:hypothetical protein
VRNEAPLRASKEEPMIQIMCGEMIVNHPTNPSLIVLNGQRKNHHRL